MDRFAPLNSCRDGETCQSCQSTFAGASLPASFEAESLAASPSKGRGCCFAAAGLLAGSSLEAELCWTLFSAGLFPAAALSDSGLDCAAACSAALDW